MASWNLGAVIVLMICGWVASLVVKNVTLVDSLWGLGFVLIAWLTVILSDGFAGRSLLIAVLVTVWGLRLSVYLSRRNWGKGEDPRYAGWREQNAENFWIVSLFKIFLLQAFVLWVIALAPQFGQFSRAPAAFTWLDCFGLLVWLAGFVFESLADRQLARFKADPANQGRVMDHGLWRYSRHPNYFGESLIWWGLFAVTLSTPGSWWTIISPLVITTVLLKMTGIPLTEQNLVERRPAYSDYIRRTSAFFPWFPRKEPS